jgi:hypothetical protein
MINKSVHFLLYIDNLFFSANPYLIGKDRVNMVNASSFALQNPFN